MTHNVQDDVAEIEAVTARSQNAMGRGDAEEVLALMTDDVVFVSPSGPPVIGKDAVRARIQAWLGQYRVEYTVAARSELTVELLRDTALVVGNDSFVMTPLGGGPEIRGHNRAVNMFRREPTGWRLARALNLSIPPV